MTLCALRRPLWLLMIKTLEWTDEGVVMVDQRLLPAEETYPVFRTYEEVAWAIKEMVVRGAPDGGQSLLGDRSHARPVLRPQKREDSSR